MGSKNLGKPLILVAVPAAGRRPKRMTSSVEEGGEAYVKNSVFSLLVANAIPTPPKTTKVGHMTEKREVN
jgi:hypothetical protein